MASGSRQQPARFTTFTDLLASSDPSQLGLQRVIGRLEKQDTKHNLIWLQDNHTPSLQIAVDYSNIEPFPFRVGVLYQFIGEVDYRDTPTDHAPVPRTLVMRALVCRCMDGLDMDVYVRAHEARMRDLERPIDTGVYSSGSTCCENED